MKKIFLLLAFTIFFPLLCIRKTDKEIKVNLQKRQEKLKTQLQNPMSQVRYFVWKGLGPFIIGGSIVGYNLYNLASDDRQDPIRSAFILLGVGLSILGSKGMVRNLLYWKQHRNQKLDRVTEELGRCENSKYLATLALHDC